MGGRNNVHVCLKPCHRHALHFTDDTCHSSTERMRMASHQGQINRAWRIAFRLCSPFLFSFIFDKFSSIFARSPIFTYFYICSPILQFFFRPYAHLFARIYFFTCVSKKLYIFTSSCIFCFHLFSPIFTYLFTYLFTYFHLFSPIFTNFHQFSPIFTYFHLLSPIFTYVHLCSPMFTYVHLFSSIFTYFHPFSPIFTYFHLFSPIFTYFHIFSPRLRT